MCSRSPHVQNLESGHFTLLLRRGLQRNVPKRRTNVQSDCFYSASKPIALCRSRFSLPSSLLLSLIKSIKLTCRCHANDISVLKYFKVLHVLNVLQTLGTRFKLFLKLCDRAAVPFTNVSQPAPVQTPAVSNTQLPHIPDL